MVISPTNGNAIMALVVVTLSTFKTSPFLASFGVFRYLLALKNRLKFLLIRLLFWAVANQKSSQRRLLLLFLNLRAIATLLKLSVARLTFTETA
jgi:hypothetical protein